MRTSEIIEQATTEGVILTLSDAGNISVTGDPTVVDKWLSTIRDRKPDILHELHRRHGHTTVMSILESLSEKRYAFHEADASADPVVLTVGIRNIATFNLEIPQKQYDGIAILEILEKLYGENYANI